jgi:hypothetical protein
MKAHEDSLLSPITAAADHSEPTTISSLVAKVNRAGLRLHWHTGIRVILSTFIERRSVDQATIQESAYRTSHDGLENDAMCCTSQVRGPRGQDEQPSESIEMRARISRFTF